jgi:hypothetical protein
MNVMANDPELAPTYRIRRFHRPGERPKGYSHSLELLDEHRSEPLCTCDVVGRAVFAHHTLQGTDGSAWHLAPNRKVLPTRWTVTDADGRVLIHFDQQVLGKLVNPLYRTLLALLDAEGNEVARVIDPRTSVPDRIFGLGPNEWALVRGEELVATLRYLPPPGPAKPGWIGRVQRFLTTVDRGIVSEGAEHALEAPVALALQILFDPLTDGSMA